MAKSKIIHIVWDGPFTLEQLSDMKDSTRDYGIYQIYGGHPVFGSNALLYIGKADQQTFGIRISQENWLYNRNTGQVRIYVGRLAGKQLPELEEWSNQISQAEKLLIFTHSPACNSQFVSSLHEEGLQDIHVLNWDNHCDLMAEVSGARWTSKYDTPSIREYKLK